MGREEEEVEEEDGGRSNDMERLARKRQSILQKLETFSGRRLAPFGLNRNRRFRWRGDVRPRDGVTCQKWRLPL